MKTLPQLLDELRPLVQSAPGSRLGKYEESFLELFTLLHASFGHAPSLHDKIWEASCRFECENGVKPTSVYLGRDEMRVMTIWFNMMANKPNDRIVARKTYNGIEIYEVDSASHLAVS